MKSRSLALATILYSFFAANSAFALTDNLSIWGGGMLGKSSLALGGTYHPDLSHGFAGGFKYNSFGPTVFYQTGTEDIDDKYATHSHTISCTGGGIDFYPFDKYVTIGFRVARVGLAAKWLNKKIPNLNVSDTDNHSTFYGGAAGFNIPFLRFFSIGADAVYLQGQMLGGPGKYISYMAVLKLWL